MGKQAPREIGQNWGTITTGAIVQGPRPTGLVLGSGPVCTCPNYISSGPLFYEENEALEAERVALVTLEVNASQVLGAEGYTPILL